MNILESSLTTIFRNTDEAEPYVPQFYTADEREESEDEKEAEEEVFVPEEAIWDLSSRWEILLFKDFNFVPGQTRTVQSRR